MDFVFLSINRKNVFLNVYNALINTASSMQSTVCYYLGSSASSLQSLLPIQVAWSDRYMVLIISARPALVIKISFMLGFKMWFCWVVQKRKKNQKCKWHLISSLLTQIHCRTEQYMFCLCWFKVLASKAVKVLFRCCRGVGAWLDDTEMVYCVCSLHVGISNIVHRPLNLH